MGRGSTVIAPRVSSDAWGRSGAFTEEPMCHVDSHIHAPGTYPKKRTDTVEIAKSPTQCYIGSVRAHGRDKTVADWPVNAPTHQSRSQCFTQAGADSD